MYRSGIAALAWLALVAGAQAGETRHYADPAMHAAIAYPADWHLDTRYSFTGLGEGRTIKGFALTVPERFITGTNLGDDTKLSVERLPGAHCQPSQFVDPAEDVARVTVSGRTYIRATSEDAGAGNRYETTVYVIDGTCVAVRYFIHYAAIGNFDPGTIEPFDRAKLMRAFDRMRDALKLGD